MGVEYMGDIYKPVAGTFTRRNFSKLELPNRSLEIGKKALSFIGPKLWNDLPHELKSSTSTNAFKHKLKDNFFTNISRQEEDIYFYYY